MWLLVRGFLAAALPGSAFARGLADAASAFAGTFVVALVLILVTLVPAFLLARQRRSAPIRVRAC